jgi:hypothetical protein
VELKMNNVAFVLRSESEWEYELPSIPVIGDVVFLPVDENEDVFVRLVASTREYWPHCKGVTIYVEDAFNEYRDTVKKDNSLKKIIEDSIS